MAVAEQFHFANVKGRILQLRSGTGLPCVGTGWLVQPDFGYDQKSITLTSTSTGMSHLENWKQVQRWLEQGKVVVQTEEPVLTGVSA